MCFDKLLTSLGRLFAALGANVASLASRCNKAEVDECEEKNAEDRNFYQNGNNNNKTINQIY